jgi:hypothetical protein
MTSISLFSSVYIGISGFMLRTLTSNRGLQNILTANRGRITLSEWFFNTILAIFWPFFLTGILIHRRKRPIDHTELAHKIVTEFMAKKAKRGAESKG